MDTPPIHRIHSETGPMLFADCPFCLQPVPLDVAAGTMDCPACAVRLELAEVPAPVALPLAA